MKRYIPKKITTRDAEQGPAWVSDNGKVWFSYGGNMYALLIALGRLSFSIDAKDDDNG